MNEKSRVVKWDNAKAVLILLVIIGHLSEKYTGKYDICKTIFFAIYTFHMPAFFFISGLFSKRTVNAEKLNWKKIVPLVILAVFLNFIRYLSLYYFDPDTNFHMFRWSNASWYLFSLAACMIIARLVRKVNVAYVLIVSVAIAAIVGYDKDLDALFALYRIAHFFPFFYLGYVIDEEGVRNATGKLPTRALSLIVLALFLVICYVGRDSVYRYRRLVTGANSYFTLSFPVTLFTWMKRVAYYGIVMVIIFAFLSMIPGRKLPVVTTVGKRTMAVYVFHLILIEVIYRSSFFNKLIHGSGIRLIAVFILTACLIAVVLSWKPISDALGWILHPQERKQPRKAA